MAICKKVWQFEKKYGNLEKSMAFKENIKKELEMMCKQFLWLETS